MYIIFNNIFEEYKNILINKPLYIYNNTDLYTQVINSNLIKIFLITDSKEELKKRLLKRDQNTIEEVEKRFNSFNEDV